MEFGNIGVFLCSCGKTLNLDLRKIARELGKLEEVAVVERVERLCTEEGLAYIVDDLRRKELDKIVVGACTTKNSLFEGVADEWGLDPLGVEIVNIREECAWVHEDGKAATQKAKVLLKSAVKRQPKLPEIVEVSVKPSILIAGDIRAVELAQGFSDLDDVEIHLLTEDPYFRRAQVESSTHAPAVKGSFYEFHEAAFHTNAKITAVKGDLGDFTVDIERGRYIDVARCVDCGRCIEVCEAKAISKAEDSTTPAYVIDERCTLCGECVKVCPTEAIFLEPEDETLSVGQIISFYPLRPQEGVYVIDEKGWAEASRRAALQAALNMRGYKKERFISSDTERCANRHLMEKKLDIKGCTYCEESCAYYPVRSGFISDLSCRGCGSCASSCPQGTYNLDFQPFEGLLGDVELTAEADLKPRIVMFTCSEGGYSTLRAAGQKGLTYPAAIPIIVPCLGNVSELHILRALDMGAEGVILLGCGAGSCMYGRGFSRGSRSAAMARSVLDFFGLGKESRTDLAMAADLLPRLKPLPYMQL
ncbi:MAG: hydrogenase iron-sulfur subunit, partial [Methanobacteriota archaeon]